MITDTIKIISVVGARPNFMKISPFIKAINQHNVNLRNQATPSPHIEHLLVHTGQHYDDRMSKAFFKALDIPEADINLEIGSGSHAEQVGQTMIAFEKVLLEKEPDWVVVVGDVNATLACSVTAKKLNIKLCHIEAGLRSGDMSMPEEINRLVTDRLSDLLLTPDEFASKNLRNEGVRNESIVFAGNIMIDTLEDNRATSIKLDIDSIINGNKLEPGQSCNVDFDQKSPYILLTLHRPSNVDTKLILTDLIRFISNELCEENQVIWPIHPRTQSRLKEFNLWKEVEDNSKIILLHPLGYHEMLRLNMSAAMLLTDSGGLQEESTVLGTPCLTLRDSTERPVTLRQHGGSSVLVGNDIKHIRKEYHQALTQQRISAKPALWDGKTAMRCVQSIINYK